MRRYIFQIMRYTRYGLLFALVIGLLMPDRVIGAEMDSEIVRVRVYTDRAEVTRRMKVNIPAGQSKHSVSGLPASMLVDSVRATRIEGGPLLFTNVQAQHVYAKDYLSEDINRQQKVVKDLEEKVKAADDELAVLNQQLKFIETLILPDSEDDNPQPAGRRQNQKGPEDWDQVLNFVASRGKAVRTAVREAGLKKNELVEELKREKRKLQDLQQGAKKISYDVHLEISATQGGKAVIEMTYQVRNTRWRPIYHLRTDTSNKSLVVEYFGEIHQNTGENWKQVEVELSTGRPALGAKVPELPPWVVDFQKPGTPVPMVSEEIRSLSRMQAAPAEKEAGLADKFASVSETGTALIYRVPRKQTVNTGAKSHRALVTRQEFTMDLKYQSVPKRSPAVYLSAEAKNTSEFHFLAGPGLVYVDGGYVGRSYLQSVAAGAPIKLGLGADDAFKVSRKLIKKEGGQKGLFEKRKSMRFVYEIEVENYRKEPATLEIKDQLPLPYHEEIKVIENEIRPAPREKDEKHILTWEIELKSGEKKVLRMDFQVEYPGDKEINGL